MRLKPVAQSVDLVLKYILKTAFALNTVGSDFRVHPELVDEDGFRPYFLDEIRKATGIASRRTVTWAIAILRKAGIITIRPGIRDGVTGQFGWSYWRFNPGALNWIAERVIELKKLGRKALNFLKSPVAMRCHQSSISSPLEANRDDNSNSELSAVDGGISVSNRNSSPSTKNQDYRLQNVLEILGSVYPEVADADYEHRSRVRKLVYSIFPRERLTEDLARTLVRAKEIDDSCYGKLGILDGHNRHETFATLTKHWRYVCRLLHREQFRKIDEDFIDQAAELSRLEYDFTDETASPTDDGVIIVRNLMTALTHKAYGLAATIRDEVKRLFLLNPIAYGVAVNQIPEVQSFCGITEPDHRRMTGITRGLQRKLAAWDHRRKYVWLENPTPNPVTPSEDAHGQPE